MAGSLIAEDARSVKSYILMDVLVPAIKDAIEDIVTGTTILEKAVRKLASSIE